MKKLITATTAFVLMLAGAGTSKSEASSFHYKNYKGFSFSLPYSHSKSREDIKAFSDSTQVMITKKEQKGGDLCGLYASSRNNWRPDVLLNHCPGDYSLKGIWFCPEGYVMMPTGHADTWGHTGENHYLIWSCVKNDGRYKDPSPDGRRLLVNYHGQKIYYGPKNYYAYTPSVSNQVNEVKRELSSEISTLQSQIASLQSIMNKLKENHSTNTDFNLNSTFSVDIAFSIKNLSFSDEIDNAYIIITDAKGKTYKYRALGHLGKVNKKPLFFRDSFGHSWEVKFAKTTWSGYYRDNTTCAIYNLYRDGSFVGTANVCYEGTVDYNGDTHIYDVSHFDKASNIKVIGKYFY